LMRETCSNVNTKYLIKFFNQSYVVGVVVVVSFCVERLLLCRNSLS